MSARPPVLCVEGLSKRIRKHAVLRDVSLEIAAGQIVGILGPNGAGKSTCFQILIGLMRPDSGTIRLDDADITHCPVDERAKRGIGYLPQETSVFTRLSVEDNVRAILEIKGLRGRALAEEAQALLADMGIAHLKGNSPLILSGGERRKLEIARALAIAPRFILLDEPFAAIDPISIGELQSTLGRLKERGIGIVITDHNVREALRVCDRAYILNAGQVISSGAPDEITADERVRQVYLGERFEH